MSFQILQRAYAPYGTAAQFPASGDSRLIYRATDTGYLYTWDASESAYKLAGIDPATVQSDISTLQTDVSAAQGDISTLQGDVATLTQGIADSVSTHNTAPDAHADIRTALAGKQDAGNFAGSSTPGGAATSAEACTGNAATATKLATARTLTIGSKGKTFDGSANVAWTLAEIGAARGLYSGLMSETVPTQSSTGLTTWVNQGTASATNTAVGLQVLNPTTSASDNIRGLVVPVPSTPYTLTALLELASIAGDYPSALLGWADSASTKTHIVTLCGDGRSALVSPTGYSSYYFSGAPAFTRDGRRVWLRFSDDGTNIAVRWSISGVYWHTLYSKAKASSHLGAAGYNRLFFGASSGNITGVATLLSWSIS